MKKLNQLITELGKKCKEKRFTLVTAESCTGGGLAYFITKHEDCSSILERGYVVYSLSSKEDLLKISPYVLQTFGAVSKEVSIEMAEKALENSKSQISIAITGIDENAAKENSNNKHGMVWISCTGVDKKTVSKQFQIKGKREKFCLDAILMSVKTLLDFIG